MTLHIGNRVTRVAEVRDARPGTLLRLESGQGARGPGYWKMENGQWERLNAMHHTHEHHSPESVFRQGTLIVEDLPVAAGPSLMKVKWHIRDGALNAVYVNGVDESIAFDVLRAARAQDGDFPWAADQKVSNRHDLNRIPVGSTVHVGRPTDLNAYTIYMVERRGEFTRIIGDGDPMLMANNQPSVWIDSIGGAAPPGTWTTDPPGSAAEIIRFKKTVWDAGWKAKKAAGWCETYEAIMHRLGVNEGGR